MARAMIESKKSESSIREASCIGVVEGKKERRKVRWVRKFASFPFGKHGLVAWQRWSVVVPAYRSTFYERKGITKRQERMEREKVLDFACEGECAMENQTRKAVTGLHSDRLPSSASETSIQSV